MGFFTHNKVTKAMQLQINSVGASTLRIRDQLQGLLGESHNGKRDIYEVYGYNQDYSFYKSLQYARREGIANRVAFGIPASCWRNGFSVVEGTREEEGEVVLDDEINLLNKKEVFSRLERADTLNRIGAFSVLYVGIPDGLDPREPVGKVQGNAIDAVYFKPFDYQGVTVSQYNQDASSERYGMPELYQMQITTTGDERKTQEVQSIIAHYTRVIHMAENLLSSDLEGIPALEPIFNRILDIDKAVGGAAEAYFRNARGKYSFEVDKDFASDLINNPEAKKQFDDAGQKFTNNWQDQITTVGAKANALNTPHASPLDTVRVALWSISGNTGIPIRVLTGEGSGQLAGSEDRLTYNALISDRQDHVCSRWVTNLLEMLSFSGVIGALPENYFIKWPLDEPLTEIGKAELANKRADTLDKLTKAASSPAGDSINLKSALKELSMEEIEVDEMEEIIDANPVTGELDKL